MVASALAETSGFTWSKASPRACGALNFVWAGVGGTSVSRDVVAGAAGVRGCACVVLASAGCGADFAGASFGAGRTLAGVEFEGVAATLGAFAEADGWTVLACGLVR